MALRLVAIGDSTVEGIEDPLPDGTYRGWADHLAAHLASAHEDVSYANLAIRGRTAKAVRAEQLPVAVALDPTHAVVVAGVNDILRPRFSATGLRDDLFAMHEALAATGAMVITFTMPDMARVAPIAAAIRPRLATLNAITHETHDTFGSVVVDLAAAPVASHPGLWHTDRLHANAEGHRRIGLALAEALGVSSEDWRSDLGPLPNRSPLDVLRGEIAWAATHLAPWAWRHTLGRSSGDERVCKRPELLPVT